VRYINFITITIKLKPNNYERRTGTNYTTREGLLQFNYQFSLGGEIREKRTKAYYTGYR